MEGDGSDWLAVAPMSVPEAIPFCVRGEVVGSLSFDSEELAGELVDDVRSDNSADSALPVVKAVGDGRSTEVTSSLARGKIRRT